MSEIKIGIIGAGKTGRGFIGRLINESGLSFVMFDKNRQLIESISSGFSIDFFSNVRESIVMDNYIGLCTDDFELCETYLSKIELLFISVGGENLVDVAKWLSGFEKLKSNINIIICENAIDPSIKFKNAFINSKKANISEGAVFCTTIENVNNKINILSENYPNIPYDASSVKLENLDISIEALKPVENFQNLLMRKIYTYNSASGIIAYLGYWKGYEIYGEAANDSEILRLLDKHYEAINNVICMKYGYDKEDQKQFSILSRNKFTDKTIVDTIERNARDPIRKLALNERIVGPARLLNEYGQDTSVLAMTGASAILYETNGSIIDTDAILGKVFIDKEDFFYKEIMIAISKLVEVGKGKLITL